MYSIGRFARKFGLSRSTLLYYDRINLLKASGRSANGYRYYTEPDASRLIQICRFRRAGLKLPEIHRLLEAQGGRLAEILESRLEELNVELETLREQQRLVVSLLQEPDVIASRSVPLDKRAWTALLRRAGFSDQDMRNWHVHFELRSPKKHQQFLELLGISAEEIRAIRSWSRAGPRSCGNEKGCACRCWS